MALDFIPESLSVVTTSINIYRGGVQTVCRLRSMLSYFEKINIELAPLAVRAHVVSNSPRRRKDSVHGQFLGGLNRPEPQLPDRRLDHGTEDVGVRLSEDID